MAKDKERSINPAAAQRKAEKQKALKKGKAAVAAQRNERLAYRNPERLEAQIEGLRARQSQGGQLSQREQTLLADLERDVNRIRKAKASLGPLPLKVASHPPRSKDEGSDVSVLGKRSRPVPSHQSGGESSDTDEEALEVPMPKDTPPPLSHRRTERGYHEPRGQVIDPEPAARIIYESKPIIRDLKKEATEFVPSVVKRKINAVRGGLNRPLLEEDDLDKLEKEGYGGVNSHSDSGGRAHGDEITHAVIDRRHEQLQVQPRQARVEDLDEGS